MINEIHKVGCIRIKSEERGHMPTLSRIMHAKCPISAKLLLFACECVPECPHFLNAFYVLAVSLNMNYIMQLLFSRTFGEKDGSRILSMNNLARFTL